MLTPPSFSKEAVRRWRQTNPSLKNLMFQRRLTPTAMVSSGKNDGRALAVLTHGKSPTHIFIHTCASLSLDRALKRTKAYSALEDLRPTIRNKPSGLKTDWHKTVKRPVLHQRVSTAHAQSGSSGSSSTFLSSPTVPRSPLPDLDSDHVSSLLAISPPPIFSAPSLYGETYQEPYQEHEHLIAVCISSRHTHFGTHISSLFYYLVLLRMKVAENSYQG